YLSKEGFPSPLPPNNRGATTGRAGGENGYRYQ
ncbi:unnamed protein product, partial [marine sediment metagenome]